MFTYQKVRLGLFLLTVTLPILSAALGASISPLDEVGGGVSI